MLRGGVVEKQNETRAKAQQAKLTGKDA